MDINPQEQVDTEQEQTEQKQVEGKENQLLEIYKLHAQLTSDVSNRLTTTNRFYPTLMSGLLALFFAFLQRIDVLFPQETNFFTFLQRIGGPFPQETNNKEYFIGYSIIAVGYFGVTLSMIWFISIRYYYRMISKKYEVLLELEAKLEFPFLKKELGDTKNIPYRQLSLFETLIPYAFSLIFIAVAGLGIFKIIS